MQGLANFANAIGDAIDVALPAFCYLAACICFFYFAWTLWKWSDSSSRHNYRTQPWVPWISLILSGVFATFPHFLTMANVSAGTNLAVGLTSYAPTPAPNAANVLGANPGATVINVVALFQHFFQAFGAACVFWAIMRWRGIINGRVQGSPTSCGIQFVFGVLCINILTVATGVEQFFQQGG